MKKIALTIAIVLGLGLTTFADPNGGGMLGRGESTESHEGSRTTGGGIFNSPALPAHGQDSNQNAPLGTGVAILTAFGAAYLVGKRRKED